MSDSRSAEGYFTDDRYAEARSTTILRTLVGSTVHGTGLDGAEDLDLMGIYVESHERALGLHPMEHVVRRTAAEGERSTPDDVDETLYSLRKWIRLAAAGNPTVLLPLFCAGDDVKTITTEGHRLRSEANRFISKRAGRKFLGYSNAQREKLLGLRGNRTNRPELVEQFGYDTKFAMHACRLVAQGDELLREGRLTLPIPGVTGLMLREIRQGKPTLAEVVSILDEWTARLERTLDRCPWPDTPDDAAISKSSASIHRSVWSWRPASVPVPEDTE